MYYIVFITLHVAVIQPFAQAHSKVQLTL